MKKNLLHAGSVLVLLLILALLPVTAQQSWQKIAPVGETFTVLMPDKATEATRRILLNEKDWILERVYYSLAGGKRYLVMSFRKTPPDRVPALSSFDKFLSSIEQAFKISEKGAPKSLAFDREVSTDNYKARQYHLKIGKYPGVVRFLETEKSFYGLMVVGAEESDTEVSRFLSSFVAGEANSNAESSGVVAALLNNQDDESANTHDSPEILPPEPWQNTVGPINAGVLNGKAISLPQPTYPKEARDAHDSGMVEVNIVIDEQGNVIKARATSGPISLREVSVAAALRARFPPTRLMWQPVKVSGRIVYNFVAY